MGKEILLYYHPTMEPLARKIANICAEIEEEDGDDDLASIIHQRARGEARRPPSAGGLTQEPGLHGVNTPARRKRTASSVFGHRHVVLRGDLRWEYFEDGFPNLFIDNVKSMAGHDVIFLASFHHTSIIFEQLSVIYSFPRYLARSFTLILPYFPTGTMERVDIEGQVVTAKSLATMLSSIPLTTQGPPQILIYDIHALQERFYFSDQVIPRLESAIPLLIARMHELPDAKLTSVAFPDEGAHKRFHTLFDESSWPTIICTKVRDADRRIVTVKEGDVAGRHVVIVDDLVKTGGTLLECAKALMERGATAVSFFVTHAMFPMESWRRFIDKGFRHFWFTDSCPHSVAAIGDTKPFELLSLAPAVAEALAGYDLRRYHV